MTLQQLIAIIDQYIKANGKKEITGPQLNAILKYLLNWSKGQSDSINSEIEKITDSLKDVLARLTDGEEERLEKLGEILIEKLIYLDIERLKQEIINPEEIIREGGGVFSKDLVALEVFFQYSKDAENWHTGFNEDDLFMRIRKGKGDWSDPMPIIGRPPEDNYTIKRFIWTPGSSQVFDVGHPYDKEKISIYVNGQLIDEVQYNPDEDSGTFEILDELTKRRESITAKFYKKEL